MRSRDLAVLLALGAVFGAGLPEVTPRERDMQPRRFTDARKAEAEAKRQRKAAKRAALAGKGGA